MKWLKSHIKESINSEDQSGLIVFLHGLESSSNGEKADFLKANFPNTFIPDLKYKEVDSKILFDSIYNQLVGQNIKLIIGPTLGMASKYELVNKSFKSAKVLEDNDIEFAIMTDHPIITLDTTLVQAALFIKEGLSELAALKALTITAAKLNGIEDRVGSLEPGKDADLVIWDGPIFDIMTRPQMVMINGEVVHQK